MSRLAKFLWTLSLAMRKGADAGSKLTLCRLLMKHYFVTRGWARYSLEERTVRFRHQGREAKIVLRDNGTDALIFADLFGKQCYTTPVPVEAPAVIFDVGANIGMASVFFHLTYPEARIFAFEPVEHELCARNIDSSVTELFRMAAGREDGSCNILIDPLNSGGHRLEHYDSNPDLKRVSVPLRRLDGLVAEKNLPRPSFLKIDAEGAECDIIEGMGDLVKTLSVVVAETQSEKNHLWIRAHLESFGFTNFVEDITASEVSQPHEAYSILWAFRSAVAAS